MKKILFLLLVFFVLLCHSRTSFAQGKDKGKDGKGKENKKAQKVQKKAAGRKTDANKPVWKGQKRPTPAHRERMERTRKAKHKAMDTRQKQGKEKAGKLPARGKEHQQQTKAFEKQMGHEKAKHTKRVARLNRIRGLAVAENDLKTAKRVDKLIIKERERFSRKQRRMVEKNLNIPKLDREEAKKRMREAQKKRGERPKRKPRKDKDPNKKTED